MMESWKEYKKKLCARLDSNPRPLDHETSGLPLGFSHGSSFANISFCVLFQLHVQRQHLVQQGGQVVREPEYVDLSSRTRKPDHVRVEEGPAEGRLSPLLQKRTGECGGGGAHTEEAHLYLPRSLGLNSRPSLDVAEMY